jgi:hypothetical protein
MKTGEKRQFTLNLADLGISKDTDFFYVEGVGWIADRNIKNNISYAALAKLGYVTGKPLSIDGTEYIIRMLTFGEWDDCIDWSDSDEVWHWDEEYSWVYLKEFERTSSRALRGYGSARNWNSSTASNVSASIGFRPCLEILNTAPLNADENAIEYEVAIDLTQKVDMGCVVAHKSGERTDVWHITSGIPGVFTLSVNPHEWTLQSGTGFGIKEDVCGD